MKTEKTATLVFVIGCLLFAGLSLVFRENISSFKNQFLSKSIPSARPYQQTTVKPTGKFVTGQAADLVLYADSFNESGGAANLDRPFKVTTAGEKLLVSDTYNNRILVWNKIPEKNATPADLVIGQSNMNSDSPGTAPDKLRWPLGMSTDGKKLAVADANNARVLIWNEFPTQNGQPADVVVGQPDFKTVSESEGKIPPPSIRNKKNIWWPWDVMIKDNKLFVISLDGSLLIWNEIPQNNYAPADIILGQKSFVDRFKENTDKANPKLQMQTPRSVAYNGKYLVVGDYNAHTMYVYEGIPQQSGQEADYIFHDEITHKVATGLAFAQGKLFATMDNSIYVWEKPFTKDNQPPDYKIGSQHGEIGRNSLDSPYGLASDEEHLFVTDTNNSRVLIFNKIPGRFGAKPDAVLGQKDFQTNKYLARNSRYNPRPTTDGNVLVVSDDYHNGLVQSYLHLPDESQADADVYDLVKGYYTACHFDGDLYCVDPNGVSKWHGLPKKKKRPDYYFRPGIEPKSLTTDESAIYVASKDKILVYSRQKIGEENIKPDLTLNITKQTSPNSGSASLTSLAQISSDGKHLAAVDMAGRKFMIWRLPITKDNQNPLLTWNGRGENKFQSTLYSMDLPSGIAIKDNYLFVADTGGHRVLGWNSLPQSPEDTPDFVLGQKNFQEKKPANTEAGLFQPAHLAFDGHFLWVGEFKWSDRLLRFSPK